jgi:glycosyltransferase involved in cell wall biosynthesis
VRDTRPTEAARHSPGEGGKWLVVAPPPAGTFDGIADFSRGLAEAVNAIETATLTSSHTGIAVGAEVRGVFLQYYPNAFVTAQLPTLLRQMSRLRARGVPIVTTVHEYWPPASSSFKRAVWRWLCKRALAAVAARSSRLVATTPYAAGHLANARIAPAEKFTVIPVPTNIPPVAAAEPPARPPALVMFGQPYVLDRAVVLGLARWVETQPLRPRWIWIARSIAEMKKFWHEIGAPPVVEMRGELPAAEVSALIAQGSIGLGVYDDGVSTRRTTLTALLAHGLPIAGLDGRYTDGRLRNSGAFLLSPLGDAPALIANVQKLLADADLRSSLASAASRLHASDFTWAGVARQYLAACNTK